MTHIIFSLIILGLCFVILLILARVRTLNGKNTILSAKNQTLENMIAGHVSENTRLQSIIATKENIITSTKALVSDLTAEVEDLKKQNQYLTDAVKLKNRARTSDGKFAKK